MTVVRPRAGPRLAALAAHLPRAIRRSGFIGRGVRRHGPQGPPVSTGVARFFRTRVGCSTGDEKREAVSMRSSPRAADALVSTTVTRWGGRAQDVDYPASERTGCGAAPLPGRVGRYQPSMCLLMTDSRGDLPASVSMCCAAPPTASASARGDLRPADRASCWDPASTDGRISRGQPVETSSAQRPR